METTALQKISEVSDHAFTPEQYAIIRNTVAKNTTDTELALFGMTCKSIGLNPLIKEIWCYKDHKSNLIIFAGRDGFLKKAQESPRWNGIASSEVRENDEFTMNIPEGKVNHQYSPQDRGKILGAYAICRPKGCEISTIEWVDFRVYDKNQFVWKSHPADMIKKVAEIKALKKAYGISGLQTEYDFNVSNDKVYAIDTNGIDNNRVNYCESLIQKSALNDEEKEGFYKQLDNITNSKLDEIIEYLEGCQSDPIASGGNYNQKDIQNKLDFIDSDDKK